MFSPSRLSLRAAETSGYEADSGKFLGSLSYLERVKTKEEFPMSRNFYVRTHINFGARKQNAMYTYGRSEVKVKVEPRSTFRFTHGLSYIATFIIYARKILHAFARKTYAKVEINL